MIYNAPDVSYEPSCEVYGWKIVQLVDREDNITRHVVANERGGGGRVSTPIVEDREDGFVTLSGRVYRCLGDESVSISGNAQLVLNAYKYHNNLEEVE